MEPRPIYGTTDLTSQLTMKTDDANTHKSVLRVVSVLKSFGPDNLELSAAEIRRKAGIPKTTVYRILPSLDASGFLEHSPETGKYRIGPGLYMLGSLYLATTDILKAAEPVVKTLNDLSGEAVSVSILDKDTVIFVMTRESKYAFRLHVHVGSTLPAYASAMGKALLSELTEAEIERLFPEERLRPITRKTVATRTALKLLLEQIRKTGISFDREGSYEGAEGIAAVIRDAGGKAVASMAITVPLLRLNQSVRERLATLIKLGSDLISYRLGYQDMDNPVRDLQEIRYWWEENQSDSAVQAENLSRLTI